MSSQAAVAAGSPDTVAAAVALLRRGGNAFDAAIAAGFAAAVAEPGLSSLGGGGFLLAHRADGHQELHDFFVDAPGRGRSAAAREPHFTPVTVQFAGVGQVFYAGYGSVAVPGGLDGYLSAHRRLGRLPLADVVAPAAALARDGVALSATQAAVLQLLDGILSLTPEGRALFLPDGRLPTTGQVLRNPQYAQTLAQIASGRIDGFATAALSDPLVAMMHAHDGLVGADDLAAYAPVVRAPLVMGYRSARIATNPRPSFGGSIVTRALDLLGADRPVSLAPHDVVRLAWAIVRATGEEKQRRTGPQSRLGTTHISVADAEGNVASMTTSNGSCSGVFVPGTGIQLNNVMGERDLHPEGFHVAEPGTRVASMMAPTIVTGTDGSVTALGSGGSERIRSALVQVIVALVDRSQDPATAVTTPRLHVDDHGVQIEPGFDPDVYDALAQQWTVNEWPAQDLYFGGAHVVRRGADGQMTATGDARRGGSAAVVDL